MNFRDSLKNDKFNNTNNQKSDFKVKNNEINEKEFVDNVNKYKNYSHNELMNEFLKKSKEMRGDGKLDNTKIKEIYTSLEPLLNDEQKENLKNLLNLI